MEIQLRSEKSGIYYANSFTLAYAFYLRDKTIWKISFTLDGESYRLLAPDSKDGYWKNCPLEIINGKFEDKEKDISIAVKRDLLRAGFRI